MERSQKVSGFNRGRNSPPIFFQPCSGRHNIHLKKFEEVIHFLRWHFCEYYFDNLEKGLVINYKGDVIKVYSVGDESWLGFMVINLKQTILETWGCMGAALMPATDLKLTTSILIPITSQQNQSFGNITVVLL